MLAKFKRNKNIRSAKPSLRHVRFSKKSAARESRQSLIFSIFLGVLIVVVIGFLAISNFRINKKRADLNTQKEHLQQDLWQLEQKRDELEAQVSQSTQEDYLETEARERFNLKKSGEEVITVLPPEEEKIQGQGEERQWWNPFTW